LKTLLLTTFWLIVLLWLIRELNIFKKSGLSKKSLYVFFGIKLLYGILLYIIYTHYNPYQNNSDALKYFDDSKVIYKTAFTDPSSYLKMVTGIGADDPTLDKYYGQMESWFREKDYSSFNDNRTIVRINALLSLLSGGVFYVHLLFFCFFSFAGLTMLLAFISDFSRKHHQWITLILFLSPSIIFWTSGLLKEAIVIYAMGGFLYQFRKDERNIKLKIALGSFFTFLLILVKPYVLICLIPAWMIWMLPLRKFRKELSMVFALFGIASVGVLVYLNTTSGQDLMNSFASKQKDFVNVSKGGAYFIHVGDHDTIYIAPETELKLITNDSVYYQLQPGMVYHHWTYWKILDTVTVQPGDTSTYDVYGIFGKTGSSFVLSELQPTIPSFIKMLPEAWSNVLFRPYPKEVRGLVIIAFAENIFYLIAIIYFLLHIEMPDSKRWQFMIGSLIFILLLAAIIGFVTPVTGAIVRYRVPLLPFLLSSFVMLSSSTRIGDRISKLINSGEPL
jgi:hypothetical protein